MASGSKRRYGLDLNCIMDFPDANNMPVFPPKPGESWIILLEITANVSLFRPVFAVKDITGASCVVAMYTPNPSADAKNFRVGHTLCITSARPQQFADGQSGFRIEDPRMIQVLHASLGALWRINAGLRDRSDRGLFRKCDVCNRRSWWKCPICTTKYCSRECQKKDWRTHKHLCLTLKALHKWNLTDFG